MSGTGKPSPKEQRNALRVRMVGQGCPLESIATEMQSRFAARPRLAWRYAYGWSQDEAAQAYNQATGEVVMTRQRVSDFESWPAGGRRPTPAILQGFADVYGTTALRLCDFADLEAMPTRDRRVLTASESGHSPSADLTGRTATRSVEVYQRRGARVATPPGSRRSLGKTAPHAPPPLGDLEGAVIMAASNESFDHAAAAEVTNVGDMTIEQLQADIQRICRGFIDGSPVELYKQLYRLRDTVYGLLDGQQYPHQAADLTLLAGQAVGLMGLASGDFGYWDAAAQQARAALIYGKIIDHHGLQAWALSQLAHQATWSGSPHKAVQYAQQGLPFAPSAAATARLRCLEAQARASSGDAAGAAEAMTHARRARDEDHRTDEMYDVIGGEWAFPLARQEYLAASAFARLSDQEHTITSAREAIELFETGPAAERSYGCVALTHVYLASGYLAAGELDGAGETLAPVFALTEDQRIAVIANQLTGLRGTLANTYQSVPAAHDLSEQIENFTRLTAARALPHLHGR